MRRALSLAALTLALAAPAAASPGVVSLPAEIEHVAPLDRAAPFASAGVASAYSNLATFQVFSLIHGGVASEGGNTSTLFVADDLTPDPAYAGMPITSIRFTVANYAPVPVTIRIRVLILEPDGPSGAPGSLIMGVIADGLTFPELALSVVVVQAPAGIFPMPGTLFWAGMSFDDHDGTFSVTPSQLSSLGQGYFDPPTIGSSGNQVFVSNTPFALDGQIFTRTGSPPYNFGWEFNVDDQTPVQVSTWGRLKTLFR